MMPSQFGRSFSHIVTSNGPANTYMPNALASQAQFSAIYQAETQRMQSQVADLAGALTQARAESEASKAVERDSKNREANALNVARNIQEEALRQRAYADELALTNDRLAREGVDLARLINDKEVSETRLKDHIRNLDANNQNMQQLMYETHARAEQLQLQRDAVIARSREVEEKLQNALAREEGLRKQAKEHEDRLARYEDALNQLNGWPLVAASANNIPAVAAAVSSSPFLPPPAALGSRLSPDPLGHYRRSGVYGMPGVEALSSGYPLLSTPLLAPAYAPVGAAEYVMTMAPPQAGRVVSPMPQVQRVQRSWSPSKPLVV